MELQARDIITARQVTGIKGIEPLADDLSSPVVEITLFRMNVDDKTDIPSA